MASIDRDWDVGPWITYVACALLLAGSIGLAWRNREAYRDPNNYSFTRLCELLEEERRLNDPNHPRNPEREISQWYTHPAKDSTPSR